MFFRITGYRVENGKNVDNKHYENPSHNFMARGTKIKMSQKE